jgi:hypothetical protein
MGEKLIQFREHSADLVPQPKHVDLLIIGPIFCAEIGLDDCAYMVAPLAVSGGFYRGKPNVNSNMTRFHVKTFLLSSTMNDPALGAYIDESTRCNRTAVRRPRPLTKNPSGPVTPKQLRRCQDRLNC